MDIEPLDEAEVNRITYMGIQPLLQSDPRLATSKCVVVEVGGGSTEVLVVQSGNVLFSHTYRLGFAAPAGDAGKVRRPTDQTAGDYGESD